MNHTSLSNSKIVKLFSVSMAGSALILQPAMAAMPDTHIFKHAAEVSDEALAGMRGRYAGPAGIIYFGVDMVTQWQTQNGRVLQSGVNLSVDKQFRPTITIVSQTTTPGTGTVSQPSAGQGNVTISGGLGNVSGVAQSIQIGGDGNAIRNDLDMNIKLNPSDAGANAAAVQGIALNGAGTTKISENGATTTFTLSSNNLSMAVDVDGKNQVLQQLRGGTNANAGFMQSTQVGSDMNQIHNTITINAGLRAASGISTPALQSSLQTLRGIRAVGAY